LALSTRQRAIAAYVVACFGLLLVVVVGIALPTRVPSPCPGSPISCEFDVGHYHGVKIALMGLGVLVASTGLFVGTFLSYLDSRE
jgi:hypothetical protein